MNISHQVVIIGGGIAGLVCSYLLRNSGIGVMVVEKNSYPFHRVCGEYVSNEVKPFLQNIGLFPEKEKLPQISQFTLTSASGKMAQTNLDLGGFGISRYAFDEFLFNRAKKAGVEFLLNSQVNNVAFQNQQYILTLRNSDIVRAKLVIGAHGKRSNIDRSLDRKFFAKRTGYIGVKYHIKTDLPAENIALHNFIGGYCGISKVENEAFNLCYLGRRKELKKYGSIKEMEKNVLYENPFLEKIFRESEFLFNEPLVINEFSFEKKEPVENDIPMIGDAAGLITPLCGNGMALAIHSAKILAEITTKYKHKDQFELETIKSAYKKEWIRLFSFRLAAGRLVQNLFGSKRSSNLAVSLMKNSRWMTRQIIKNTHGEPIFY